MSCRVGQRPKRSASHKTKRMPTTVPRSPALNQLEDSLLNAAIIARMKSHHRPIFEATRLAFGPVAFQVARVMRVRGLLRALLDGPLTTEGLVDATGVSRYGVDTLCEAGISFELVEQADEGWRITRTGRLIELDPMTRANMDFVHDVCFLGLARLDEAIDEGAPAGLRVFGEWSTVYEALSQLPEPVRRSWFAFDHHYSDRAFERVVPKVFAHSPKRLLDIGGNTGKWALCCTAHDPRVEVTIADLPGQLAIARTNVDSAGVGARIHAHPIDVLDADAPFPTDFDAVWMSQFLVCFSLQEIRHILRRAGASLTADGSLWILDNYWDRQRNDVARHVLHGTSIYFTAIANGTSRVYSAKHLLECLADVGLQVVEEWERLGASGHTLWRCRPC